MPLEENLTIKLRDPKDKVYSHEPNAQETYDKYCDFFAGRKKLTSKDIETGSLCEATIVSISAAGQVAAQTDSYQTIYLDLVKESRFLDRHQFGTKMQIGAKMEVLVDNNTRGVYSGSVEKAFKNKLKKDLLDSMKNQNSAYKVTIKSINDGGFIVDLAGMDCFMPGSLAAANKISNFEVMLGKEVFVMVENYLEQSDMFVVSNKKYIQSILPGRVKQLDFTKTYTGTVTGVMPYGAFVEWDEIFTGLLHESESAQSLKGLKSGMEVSFFVKEIKEIKDGKDIRIILTQKEPSADNKLFQEFKNQYEGEVYDEATIKNVKPIGIFVELKNGLVGMLPPREFKKTGAKAKEGEVINVFVKSVDVALKRIYLKAEDTTESES